MTDQRNTPAVVQRTYCWSCANGGDEEECEWVSIEDDMRTQGEEFFENRDAGDDEIDADGKMSQAMRDRIAANLKATRFFLYTYYHHQHGNGGNTRTPLPLCVEAKIKEIYADPEKKFVGYQNH